MHKRHGLRKYDINIVRKNREKFYKTKNLWLIIVKIPKKMKQEKGNIKTNIGLNVFYVMA